MAIHYDDGSYEEIPLYVICVDSGSGNGGGNSGGNNGNGNVEAPEDLESHTYKMFLQSVQSVKDGNGKLKERILLNSTITTETVKFRWTIAEGLTVTVYCEDVALLKRTTDPILPKIFCKLDHERMYIEGGPIGGTATLTQGKTYPLVGNATASMRAECSVQYTLSVIGNFFNLYNPIRNYASTYYFDANQ